MRKTLEDRLSEKIDASGDCWLWIGSREGSGYGNINIGGSTKKAHRVMYEALVGPIPEGLVIDHLCRVKACVNPDHLQPVTFTENVRRGISQPPKNRLKTHCHKGHEFTDQNTYRFGKSRACRECRRATGREWIKDRRLA